MGLYNFIKSSIGSAGIGAGDMAFVQPNNLIPASIYGQRYNVQRQLGSQSPGFVMLGSDIVPVSILGDTGLGLQGTYALTALAEAKG